MLCKKPIFSFLETEIVKALKKVALNPPADMIQGGLVTGQADDKDNQKSALDRLML